MSQGLIQNIFIFILCCPSSILGKLTQYMWSQYCLCTTNKQLHITKATRWTDKQSTKDFDVHGTLCYTYVIRIISIFLLKHAFFFLGTALMSLTACCHKHFLVFLCPLSFVLQGPLKWFNPTWFQDWHQWSSDHEEWFGCEFKGRDSLQ